MDELYRKLHERYTDLKKRKFSELDEMGKDQEDRFSEYVSANEDVIQHLENDRERLKTENCNLRSQINLIISKREEEHEQFRKELSKMKDEKTLLLHQIEDLKTLINESVSCSSPENDKFFRNQKINEKSVSKSPTNLMKTNYMLEAQENNGEGLKGRIKGIEFDKTEYFQQLLEILMGMKFSHLKQGDGSGILVIHQSSGYSFELKWMNRGKGEEAELLYCVSKLGACEPIAPDWMRSTLKFGVHMCPIFFKKIARVLS